MHKDSIKALSIIIANTKHDIQNYYEKDSGEKFENTEVNNSLEHLLKQLENTKNTLNHYLRDMNEWYLVLENISSNYIIKFLNGNSFQPLICGCYIEVYVNNKGWTVVKVEYSSKEGYSFYNPEIGYTKLYPNMKVRLR